MRARTAPIAACRVLWAESPASFHSETVSFEKVWCGPRPVQAGGVPVWFSGTLTKRNLDRIVRLGDGWIPILAPGDDAKRKLETLRGHLQGEGRDPADFGIEAWLRMGLAEPDIWAPAAPG